MATAGSFASILLLLDQPHGTLVRPNYHQADSSRDISQPERAGATIREYIDVHNEDPKPIVWTRSADQILASIARFAQRTANSVQAR
jgi:hypothetical protein